MDSDFIAGPSGGAGLTAPLIPKGQSLIDPRLLMSAVSMSLERKERARQLDLTLQKMINDEQLAREKFQYQKENDAQDFELKKQALAQAGELKNAQIGNLNAERDLRVAQAKQEQDGTRYKWQHEAQLQPTVGEYEKALNAITEPLGSQERTLAIGKVSNDFADSGIFSTTSARSIQARALKTNTDAGKALVQVHKQGMADYDNTLKGKGINDYAVQYLADDDQNIWGKNADGSRYIAVTKPTDTDRTGGAITPLSALKGLDPKKQDASYRFVTLKSNEVENLLSLRKRNQALQTGRELPDVTAMQDVASQGDQVITGTKPLDQATATQLLQQSGGDKNKARQLARDQGYTF